ncbi:(S)-mandelate dehydrogenase [compost metagenome]
MTVDTPVMPKREFNVRNGFDVPLRFSARNVFDVATHPRWALGVLGRYVLSGGLRQDLLHRRKVDSLDLMPDLSWEHMKGIRDRWKGNLIIKGILRPDDALRAKALGADGIVVSNHGGRNLDFAVSPIEVLREISDSVGSSLTVLADSSVQRGSDVFKLLANGAKAVLVGRSMLYGTAAGGQAGALRMMHVLTEELGLTMDMSGCRSIDDIQQSLLQTAAN